MATEIKPIKSIKKNQFTPKIRGKSNRALSNIGKTNLSLFFFCLFLQKLSFKLWLETYILVYSQV